MGELDGRVAVVTGGARGLGAAIVEVFVREGARVVATDIRVAEGQATAEQFGDQVSFIEHDVADTGQWSDAIAFATATFGPLDILVNNAGLAELGPFGDTNAERWDHLIGVMQRGPFLGMQTVLPAMVEAGSGAIVNVASTLAIRGMAGTGAYASAKHGLLGLTRSTALEFAPVGIRINAVCPGAMRTPMNEEAFGDELDAFAAHVPAGRLGAAAEVAELVSFLASPRASFCVGATFVADGGMTVG